MRGLPEEPNGNALQDQAPDATSFNLSSLARGTYVIAATVKDTASGETQAPDSVTFYVRQPSALAPFNPLK